eukprot:scaffold55981_cov78-Attheya_sp.AAC.3
MQQLLLQFSGNYWPLVSLSLTYQSPINQNRTDYSRILTMVVYNMMQVLFECLSHQRMWKGHDFLTLVHPVYSYMAPPVLGALGGSGQVVMSACAV